LFPALSVGEDVSRDVRKKGRKRRDVKARSEEGVDGPACSPGITSLRKTKASNCLFAGVHQGYGGESKTFKVWILPKEGKK